MTATQTMSPDAERRDASAPSDRKRVNWFAAFWRWHFYGSVLVIPVLLVLAVTGLTYMYRAQVDAWTHPGVLTVAAPEGAERLPLSQQEEVVREAFPERNILSLVDHTGERATVFVTSAGEDSRNVYVDPYRGVVTGDLAPEGLISDWAERIHGTLLIGDAGDRIIELGASWAIVMTITGFVIFFLGRRPRKNATSRGMRGATLRGAHAVVGLPVGIGLLLLVVSGLPWTGLWGSQAQQIAAGNGMSLWGEDPGGESKLGELIEKTDGKSGPAGWAVSNGDTAHSHGSGEPISVDRAVLVASGTGAPGPYSITYPVDEKGVYSVFGWQWSNNGNPAEADVSRELAVHVDQYSGNVVGTYGYQDYSMVAKTVSQGIALHEGRRFGTINTIGTTLFCLAVIFLCVSAPIMWWKRRGAATGLAAPRARLPIFGNWILLGAVAALGLFLPLFGLSLLLILAVDQLIVRRVPSLARAFGSAR
ncbi:PepSY-associated TM helix domain-containing protein [Enemella sp. A6]|uniref:PepSY-associated TM helix domain-containing protein n=1 Tax=Enemella sp. A6 TaxID=3440152 RepID=UPI003EBB31A7